MDAYLLHVTGWPPSELDNCDQNRLARYLLYRGVSAVVAHGGEFKP